MKLKITTLVIVEEGQVQDIYHSLNDNQDKAYEEIIDQVNAEYGDGGVLQFKNIKGIKNYFDSVIIETQELTPIGFKNTLLNRETKRNPRTKYTYLTRINGMNTFLLQVNQTPITTQTQVQSSTSTHVPKTN